MREGAASKSLTAQSFEPPRVSWRLRFGTMRRISTVLDRAYRTLFYDPRRAVAASPYISVGASTLGRSFAVEMRSPRATQALVVGDDCILQCRVVFESSEGLVTIGDGTAINAGTTIIARQEVVIGSHVTIAWGCLLYDHDSHSLDYRDRRMDQERQLEDWATGDWAKHKDWTTVESAPIAIGDDAWLGFDVVVLKGVTIGRGAVVGARSVVTRDVPAWSVVAGNPARVVSAIPAELRADD